jgi:hypothetical protein
MPLDTYANLQTTVLDWLARPGDPLVAPAVPDMIAMFEEEARDRLQSRFTEKSVAITPDPDSAIVLPLDWRLRGVWIDTANGRRRFTFQTPSNMDRTSRSGRLPAATRSRASTCASPATAAPSRSRLPSTTSPACRR